MPVTSVSVAHASSRRLVTDETMVDSIDPGIAIYVRNKRPADMTAFVPARTLLFVHGATYPAHATFDLALDGLSWMDYIAARGYDVYLLDIRGYGKATRPPEMAERPEENPPVARADAALRDIGAVVDFILQRRGIARLCLLGWSWGTSLTATYTTRHPGKVARLALYAPTWIRTTPSPLRGSGPLGAYRTVTREQARARWYAGVAEDKKAALIPAGWFDAWAEAVWASDPDSAKREPPAIRAPNGVLQDSDEFYAAGRSYYDPAKITVPTLVVVGAWDHDTPPAMAQALFPLLANAPDKRLVLLPEGTHHMMLEAHRLTLFETVQSFLDAGG